MTGTVRSRRLARVAAALILLIGGVASVIAQTSAGLGQLNARWSETETVEGIEILPVLKNVYLLGGGGAHVVIQFGDQGITMVDTGAAGQAVKVQAAIRRLTSKPLRYLINTSADPDHVGGNAEMVGFAGGTNGPEAGGPGAGGLGGRLPTLGTAFIAHEGAYNQMVKGRRDLKPLTGAALPASTFFTARKDIYLNGEAIEILHQPDAHTAGDVIVFFRGSDVVAAGDVYRTDRYPMIDLENGGSIKGELDALNTLLDIAVPERNEIGGTRIVPGHGRISNETDVVDYRDMVTIVRDRVKAMIDKGMTVAQIKAAKPALEYDGVYGTNKEWTGDMFLEAVYTSLKK